MNVWVCGCLSLWVCWSVDMWVCETLVTVGVTMGIYVTYAGTWACGPVSLRVCGSIDLCVGSPVSLWVWMSFALWVWGPVGVWICGCVGLQWVGAKLMFLTKCSIKFASSRMRSDVINNQKYPHAIHFLKPLDVFYTDLRYVCQYLNFEMRTYFHSFVILDHSAEVMWNCRSVCLWVCGSAVGRCLCEAVVRGVSVSMSTCPSEGLKAYWLAWTLHLWFSLTFTRWYTFHRLTNS